LFTDSGMAQLVSPNKNLINGYAWPDRFKTSVGCGLSFAREALRVDFARRLDQGRDNWSVLVRLMRSL